jgi:nitroreductase
MQTWEAITSRRNVRSFADLPIPAADLEDRGWALLISLGYPAGRPLAPVRKPDRRPFGEVVHRERW